MKAYEITFSPTGGTKQAADIMMSAFPCEKEEISILHPSAGAAYEFTKDDICLFAVPSFGGRVPKVAAQRLLTMKGNGARAVLVCVYGNRAYEDTLLELKNIAEEAGFYPVAAVAAVAGHSIMRQFAAGRPDAEDTAEIKGFGERIWTEITMERECSPLIVPGNEPYREYGCIPFIPTAGEECTNCGLCAKECPVAAIDRVSLKADEKKCISCMRCIQVCPKKARSLDEAMVSAVSQKMEKAFEIRKKNELYCRHSGAYNIESTRKVGK